MHIVVTGANGFVGSWISQYFAGQGYKVAGLVRPDSNASRLKGDSNLSVLHMDPRDWGHYIEVTSPKILILADWAGVAGSEADSNTQMDNLIRWQSLAISAQRVGVEKVVAFGSQAEVGCSLTNVDEFSTCNPKTIYGKAKLQAFELLEEIFKHSDTTFIWARIFTVYGPKDNDNWLIPSAIKALASDEVFETTKGEQNWNYLYILDLCVALKCILVNTDRSDIFNIASPKSIQIHEILKMIENQMGKHHLIRYGARPYSVNQIMNVTPNIAKLEQLGWSPFTTLEEGIGITIKNFLLEFTSGRA